MSELENGLNEIKSFINNLWFRRKDNARLPVSHASDDVGELVETNIFDAQLISSKTGSGYHTPMLDIDFPITVVKSSSGNSHIYFHKLLTEVEMDMLVNVLEDCSILQPGVAQSWRKHKMLTLRPPWVKKQNSDRSWSRRNECEPVAVDNSAIVTEDDTDALW